MGVPFSSFFILFLCPGASKFYVSTVKATRLLWSTWVWLKWLKLQSEHLLGSNRVIENWTLRWQAGFQDDLKLLYVFVRFFGCILWWRWTDNVCIGLPRRVLSNRLRFELQFELQYMFWIICFGRSLHLRTSERLLENVGSWEQHKDMNERNVLWILRNTPVLRKAVLAVWKCLGDLRDPQSRVCQPHKCGDTLFWTELAIDLDFFSENSWENMVTQWIVRGVYGVFCICNQCFDDRCLFRWLDAATLSMLQMTKEHSGGGSGSRSN